MITVLKVNGKRYLINQDSVYADDEVNNILSNYPKDAIIEFEEPTIKDLMPSFY